MSGKKIRDRRPLEGYCPTIKEVNSDKIKDLANRLKADSTKETLTNVLDWEDRNINFWMERWYIAFPFCVIIGLLIISFVAYVEYPNKLTADILLITSSSCLSVFLIINIIIKSYYKASSIGEISNEFSNMVINRSLDIDYILKNHLAVCRDYSKFTACLLLNLYPDADIYFVFAPGHVAPGIKLNDKIYILDQTLPISTLEKWGNFYNKGSTKYKTLKIVEEQNSKFLNLSNNAYFDASTSNTTIDLEALSMKISNILAINNQSSGNKKFVKPLKNLKKFYEDDEVISYSLARAIKNRLSDELCGEIKRITKLEIKYNDDRESLPVLVCNFN